MDEATPSCVVYADWLREEKIGPAQRSSDKEAKLGTKDNSSWMLSKSVSALARTTISSKFKTLAAIIK